MLPRRRQGKPMFNRELIAGIIVRDDRTKKEPQKRLSGVKQGGVKRSGSNHSVRIQITGYP